MFRQPCGNLLYLAFVLWQRGEWKKSFLLVDKGIEASAVSHIVFDSAGTLWAVLGNESVETVLTAANGDDFGAFFDELVCHGCANAGGGTDEENALILEYHFGWVVC